ncbi:MAG: energy transducer TonB [Chitinophagales bacterium]|nr:energy transducer TonB [Chitinophagales bacterium]
MKTTLTLFALLWAVCLQAQTDDSDSIVFTMVEEMPEYAGGQDGLMKYLASIVYPIKAKDNDIEGTVYAKFIIEKNGEVGNVEVAKSSGAGILDSAVVSHVQAMPAWKPGTQQGKPVRVQYVVPVKFYLSGGSPPQKKKKRD